MLTTLTEKLFKYFRWHTWIYKNHHVLYFSITSKYTLPLVSWPIKGNSVFPFQNLGSSEQLLSPLRALSLHFLSFLFTGYSLSSSLRGGGGKGVPSPGLPDLPWVLHIALTSPCGSQTHTHGLPTPASALGVQVHLSHFRGTGRATFLMDSTLPERTLEDSVLGNPLTYCYFITLVSTGNRSSLRVLQSSNPTPSDKRPYSQLESKWELNDNPFPQDSPKQQYRSFSHILIRFFYSIWPGK